MCSSVRLPLATGVLSNTVLCSAHSAGPGLRKSRSNVGNCWRSREKSGWALGKSGDGGEGGEERGEKGGKGGGRGAGPWDVWAPLGILGMGVQGARGRARGNPGES